MPAERRIAADPRERSVFRADRAVAAVAAEEWGVLSTAELLACGLTPSSISRRRKRGHLHRLHTGVWAIGHPNPPWEGRMLAAVKACGPNAFLSHYSAAELWGFVDRLDRVPDVSVNAVGSRAPPGIRTHKILWLEPEDRRVHLAIPVVSPARALLDLASTVGARRVRAAARRAQGLGRVTVRQIGWVLERYPGYRGCRILRQAIESGAAPTNSERESDVLDLILEGGLAHPDVNKPLVVDGRRVVPDLRWPAQRLILEVDSTAWHDDPLARADDRERQALLEAHGETVLRVHWRDAVLRPARTLGCLRAAGAPSRTESRLACDPR
jgi:hypothetical protein